MLELKDINCENWLKLRGAKSFSGGGISNDKDLLRSSRPTEYSTTFLQTIV